MVSWDGERAVLELQHLPGSAEGTVSGLGLHQEGPLPVHVAVTCVQKHRRDKIASQEPEEQPEHPGKQNISCIVAGSMMYLMRLSWGDPAASLGAAAWVVLGDTVFTMEPYMSWLSFLAVSSSDTIVKLPRLSKIAVPQLKNSWRWGKEGEGECFQLTLTSLRADVLRNDSIVEKCNCHGSNQEYGHICNSSDELLCFPFDVISPIYFGCPTFIQGAPDPSAEQNTSSSFTEVLQDHHLTLKVAKPTGFVLVLCIVCSLGPCLVGFPPWSWAPHGSPPAGPGPPRSQEPGRAGRRAGLPCASMQYNWRDFVVSYLSFEI